MEIGDHTKLCMKYLLFTQSVEEEEEFLLWLSKEKIWLFMRNFTNISNKFSLNYKVFDRVKELPKSNQTRYAVFPV